MYKLFVSIGACLCLTSFCSIRCISQPNNRALPAIERGELCQAIEVFESDKKRDLSLLGTISEALLEREAKTSNKTRRDAAFAQLNFAGTGARQVLQRLVTGKAASVTRVKALERCGN
jgi:hypothetical protein